MTEPVCGFGRPLFTVAGREVVRLSVEDAPTLQRLLERCGDYYEMIEGRPAGPNAAVEELTEGPPERVPQDLFALGITGAPGELAGVVAGLCHHRRPNQWYLGLMLLDPVMRRRGLGRSAYRAFETWAVEEGADSMLLAVVEVNHRALRFWENVGFGWPRCYPERTIGVRQHVLIELEKSLA